ncbi:NAD(P)/FAD-dependent oxidoreductase [Magnetospira sp. QH-2]|uniref:NAD(P)/FAD-dependent oxidoreductase n=1 Tax=Magnetospira sp. (strain QH-2) TaxID=1288970 RepID=UPI0003E80AD7|nr:NAD(P)/FAD-dependent oxidoreductase [Magnetospira sp. QH-2]CCQ73700.1 Sulfide dehydrogenase [flavocytochrome c] flavoprotein chain [Magnetospira sp. QH-2]
MSTLTRRDMLRLTGAAAATTTIVGCNVASAASRRVVVVGGGTGGATAAKYLRMADPTIEVTLIEPLKIHHTCYLSNEVLSGHRSIDQVSVGYDGLMAHGITVVHDMVTAIDGEKQEVVTKGGDKFGYDRCIVSPGVDFKWETIEGYNADVANTITHAWKAGPQTVTLRKQLEAMRDGGTVIISAPTNPFRCPPGPYERASQIAMYLQAHKPKSKVLILDPKDTFSKKGLFEQAWKKLYGYGTSNSLIEWVPAAEGGKITGVDAKGMTLAGDVDDFKGDVINIIPAQKAGKIAFAAGLTEGDWCPVDKKTFESKLVPKVHVIGDASSSAKMPKSGYAANSQAKVTANAVMNLLNGMDPETPAYVNTCYSIAGKGYGFSVAAVYQLDEANNQILPVKGSGGLTPMDANAQDLMREVSFAHSWYDNIVHDSFG